ncbi:MAG: glycosyltransferase family 4 protein [Bacteroidales bacterium]|nr:glycosyltransferase family 4 protein [Bacteroidales bacterium]
MIIGYDGKRAIHNLTGLGNYSRLILETMGQRFPDRSLVVYTPSMKESPRLTRLKSLRNVQFRLPDPALRFKGTLWRSFGITSQLKTDNLDLFHGLSNELPLNIRQASIPSVVTIHDVIYRRLPYCYKPIDRRLYDIKYGAACRNATRIIAVSECTKKDIVEIYGVNPDKIDVVYQGCDETFKTPLSKVHLEEVRRKYELPNNYILQVGTIERRKNLEITLRALSALPHNIHLVAVGRGGDYLEKMKVLAQELGIADRVHFRNNIPFTDLPAINQRADIIVYPSHYEGFGIPVLEALESKRPIIAAKGSCLEEAGGDAAWYIDPNRPEQLSEILRGLIDGSIDPTARIARGKEHARSFDNSEMAHRLDEVYRRTIADFRR